MDNQHSNLVNKLSNTYKGVKNVNVIFTKIDILTDTKIIIIRQINKWAEGIGLLTTIATQFNGKEKHLHIYSTGNNQELINKLITLCIQLEITLTFEE
jgi:hypothetical protein